MLKNSNLEILNFINEIWTKICEKLKLEIAYLVAGVTEKWISWFNYRFLPVWNSHFRNLTLKESGAVYEKSYVSRRVLFTKKVF